VRISLDGIAARNSNAPVSPLETEGPIGLVSGKPMRFMSAPIFDTRDRSGANGDPNRSTALENLPWNLGRSQASAIDADAPAAPVAPNRQNLFDNANGAASRAGDPGDVFASPTSAPQNQQGPLSLNDAYLLYRKRLDANASRASAMDAGAPVAPLASPDDSSFSGGLLGRMAALMGVNPQNPDQLAPPPQDDELRAFYRDNPAQPLTLRRLR
jgi:hypothetical protein